MELVLILVFAYFVRFIFILKGTSDVSDDIGHLWNIQLRKKIGNPWEHRIDDISVFPGKRAYPPLAAYVVSIFPREYWGVIARNLNILYDCVVIACSYFLGQYLFGTASLGPGLSSAGWLALIIASSPILLPTTARMSSFGARSFGFMLIFFYFLCLAGGLYAQTYLIQGVYLIPCLLLGILIMMCSQFALQVFVFFSLLLSGFYLSFYPLLILLLVFGIALFFPNLGLKDILSWKLEHYKWYFKNQNWGTTASKRNTLTDHLKLLLYLFTDFYKFRKIVFTNSSYLIALYSLPPLLFSVSYFFYANLNLLSLSAPTIEYSILVTSAAGIVFFLSSLPPLLFLGQAERYFEYVTPFFCYVFIYLFINFKLPLQWLYYTLLIQLIFFLINYLESNRGRLKNTFAMRDEVREVVNFLREKNPRRIMTIPAQLSRIFSFSLMDEHEFYINMVDSDAVGMENLNKGEDWIKYDYPQPPLTQFKGKYDIDTLIVSDNFQNHKHDFEYDFDQYELIFENSQYTVYSL